MKDIKGSKKLLLVGFVGEIGSGKDTAADFLAEIIIDEKAGEFPIYFAFADVLKNIVDKSFGLDRMSSDSIKRLENVRPFNGKNLRQVYQDFGETIKEYFGEQVWVNQTINRLLKNKNILNSDLLICTDVRYSYEEKAIRKFASEHNMDCALIHMINLNMTQRDDNKNLSDFHKSELLHDIITDYKIEAKNIKEIQIKIREIIKEIGRKKYVSTTSTTSTTSA